MATIPATLPDFDLELNGGKRITAADLRGRRSVLFFYPKDNTSGCTMEAREFTALLPEFTRRDVAVYGVSPDSAKSHDKFVSSCDLGIPLISDVDRQLCEAFGVWVEKSMYGRSYHGVERSTFLIGPDGSIDREWRKVTAAGHAQEVLDAVS